MDWVETLRQTAESIAEHPKRVLASAMGVFWGTAAIVLLLSWGTGVADHLLTEFGRYGRPALFVIPGVTSSGFPGYRPAVEVRFDRDDAARVERDTSELVAAVLPEHMAQGRLLVEAGGRVRRLDLTASDQRFPTYRRFEIGHGRFFDAGEVERYRPVAVLGHDAAEDLFGSAHEAVGRTLRASGQPFEVIGVFARKEGRQYMNTNRPDNRLLVVPSTTAESRLGMDPERVSWMTVYPRPGADSKEALRAVRRSLAERAGFHPDDADAVRSFDIAEILASIGLMKIGLTFFIGLAGTITLLVGGVGIANFHLATLAERSVEISLAKAVGARNRTLMLQAVLESLLVSASAGLLGLGLGLGVTLAASRLLPAEVFPAPVVSTAVAVVALTALLGVAAIAALVPALRVRRMDISAALRS